MKKNRKAIFRLDSPENEAGWLHYSQRGEKVILRSLPRGGDGVTLEWSEREYSLPEDQDQLNQDLRGAREYSLSEVAALTVDAVDVAADRLSVEEVEQWRVVLDRLDELGAAASPPAAPPAIEPDDDASAGSSARSETIPQTRLRRFYETLLMLNSDDVQKEIAGYFAKARARREQKIQVMFQESVDHFRRYRNPQEALRDPRRESRRLHYADDPGDFAHCMVARLAAGNWYPIAGERTEIQCVDFEISPYRSTGRVPFESGKVGTSGGGGLDLLLRDRADRLVIGEVKARNNKNLFLALIQSLTYAVELTSGPQMARVKSCYPDHYTGLMAGRDGGLCDIFLIYPAGDQPKLLEETRRLATALLIAPGSPVARKVRRVAFIEASLENGGVQLESKFSTPDT